ncbi:MAG: pilus assembly protein PilM [Candidatus Omnitrophota bacterium]
MKKKQPFQLKSKKVVGLHIGVATIDIVVLKSSLQGPKLVTFGQTPIYPKELGSNQAQVEAEGDALISKSLKQRKESKKSKDDYIVEAIQRLIKELHIRPSNVACSISNEESMVRYFQMPKMPKHEWDSAVHFEAKRYIPFRIEDVSSDYQTIKSKTPSGNMEVLFVAVKESHVSRLISLLEKAGINPSIIEPASFSLLRAFNAAEQIDTSINTAIVSIDSSVASINILRKGIPYIIRDIAMEELKGDSQSSSLIYEKLLAEIKLSFDFYEKQFPSEIIDKVIIYSNVPLDNWHEVVGKELQVPVEIGDPFRSIKMKKGAVPPKLAVAFGLSLRGISEPFLDINLYKERQMSFKQKELVLRTILLECFIAIIVLLLLQFFSIKSLSPLLKELEDTISMRPKIAMDIGDKKLVELEELKDRLLGKKDEMEDILDTRVVLTEKLSSLADVIPTGAWLKKLVYKEKRLSIKGNSLMEQGVSENVTANNLLVELEANSTIAKDIPKGSVVSVSKSRTHNQDIADFEILFTIKKDKGTEKKDAK